MKTLKQVLGKDWIEYFIRKETIDKLINRTNLGDEKLVRVQSVKKINEGRISLIINTTKSNNGTEGCHMIDVILSEPTWEQMMDVTFGIGAECDTRIIIYDDSAQWKDRVSNRYAAAKFASINNDCGMDTYIINAHALEICKRDEPRISYTIEASPEVGYDTDYQKLPSREQFEKAEFWLYFDKYAVAVQERIYDPNWWIGGPVVYFIDEVIDAFPIWDENGFYVRATADNFSGHQALVELFITKRNEIEQYFKSHDPDIRMVPGGPIIITVKYSDRPFSSFVSMGIDGKNRSAENCRNILSDFCGFFEGLINDIEETTETV